VSGASDLGQYGGRSESAGVDLSTTPKQADRSMGELFGQLTADLGDLMRKEVQLARLETKEEVGKAGKAAAMLGAGGAAAYLALILLSFALVWLLDEVMHIALAFLIVGVVWAIVAAVLVAQGRNRMRQVSVPEQTVQTVKEDVEWARAQRS